MNFLSPMKNTYNEPTTNITPNGERLLSPAIRNMARQSALTAPVQH